MRVCVCVSVYMLFAESMILCVHANPFTLSPGLQDVGGRITLFHSTLPTVGEGKLVNREAIRSYGALELEQPMYLPDEKGKKFYVDLGTAAAGRQVRRETLLPYSVCVCPCMHVHPLLCAYPHPTRSASTCLCVGPPSVTSRQQPRCAT